MEERASSRQYLTFTLGKESFGINVANVREILELVPITPLPGMPAHVSGIINVRDSVVPVMDLRMKLGMGQAAGGAAAAIVVTELVREEGVRVVGALVDSVQEVVDFEDSQLEPPPTMGTGLSSRFVRGIGKRGDTFVMVLDAEQVLGTEEIAEAAEAADAAEAAGKASP